MDTKASDPVTHNVVSIEDGETDKDDSLHKNHTIAQVRTSGTSSSAKTHVNVQAQTPSIISSSKTRHSQAEHDSRSKASRLKHVKRARLLASSYVEKHKGTSEQPKIVISRSKWQKFNRFLVLIPPVLAAIVMAVINLKGYFIGTQFVGVGDAASQSIALLALQVTAKVFVGLNVYLMSCTDNDHQELIVITSLGFIILDVLHYFLLADDSGLPLSLSGARFTFTNPFYFTLPSFWSGIGAFRSLPVRIGIVLLLISSGLIATFVGPATALLLIPGYKDQWLGGNMPFNAFADNTQLWPSQLNDSHIGGTACLNPLEETVNMPFFDNSNCSWFAAATIEAAFANSLAGSPTNLTVWDQSLRSISWSVFYLNDYGEFTWAYSSMSSISQITFDSLYWWLKIIDKTSWSFLSKYSRYSYRQSLGNSAQLTGAQAPMARTYCIGTQQNFSDTNLLPYPVAPLFGNYRRDTQAQYMISTTLLQNISSARSFWIPKPDASAISIVPASDTNYMEEQLPSAFLVVQIPVNSSTEGIVISCSVDARWVKATAYVDFIGDVPRYVEPTVYTRLDDAALDTEGRPINSSTSTRVDLDISWLTRLTPTFSEVANGNDTSQSSDGFTSLSQFFTLQTLENFATNGGDNISIEATGKLESLAAGLVVDGMARLTSWDTTQNNQEPAAFLMGESVDGPPTFIYWVSGPLFEPYSSAFKPLSTTMTWSVTITGYAYAIDGTAYILALTVVLAYVLFALGYMYFLITKKAHSMAWWSIPEIIALSQNSPSSQLLKNTSGGIEKHATNQLLLKLRASDVPLGDRESVHILVSKADETSEGQELHRYHKLEQEKAYY